MMHGYRPGQWGSNAVIFFAATILGIIVVTRVQKLDISLAFLLTFYRALILETGICAWLAIGLFYSFC